MTAGRKVGPSLNLHTLIKEIVYLQLLPLFTVPVGYKLASAQRHSGTEMSEPRPSDALPPRCACPVSGGVTSTAAGSGIRKCVAHTLDGQRERAERCCRHRDMASVLRPLPHSQKQRPAAH